MQEILINCDRCDNKYWGYRSYHCHAKLKHKGRICCKCFKMYDTLQELREHKLDKHRTKGDLKCLFCDKKFYKGSERRQHYMESHPGTGYLSLPCTVCNQKFRNKYDLKQHKLLSHSITSK